VVVVDAGGTAVGRLELHSVNCIFNLFFNLECPETVPRVIEAVATTQRIRIAGQASRLTSQEICSFTDNPLLAADVMAAKPPPF